MLTPLDIQNKNFKKKFNGYSKADVEEFFSLVCEAYDKLYTENAALRDKIEELQKQIYKTKQNMPKDVDYEEKLAALQDAIRLLKDPTASPIDQNQAVRAVVERIEYYSIPSIGKGEKGYIKGYNSFNIKVRMRY